MGLLEEGPVRKWLKERLRGKSIRSEVITLDEKKKRVDEILFILSRVKTDLEDAEASIKRGDFREAYENIADAYRRLAQCLEKMALLTLK